MSGDIHSSVPDQTRIALYGSTGSIGKTALEVIAQNNTHEVVALFARSSVDLFVEQVRRFSPHFAGLVDEGAAKEARALLGSKFRGTWLSGDEIEQFAVSDEYDLQLAAVIGVEGLATTLPAYRSGKTVALANKESLVVGGCFFANSESSGTLLPVDSEHSSLFRLLAGVSRDEVRSLVLTASGGPFWRRSLEELKDVTVEEALDHPTWNMGTRITLDSATLMNKAFEVIETYWLFQWPEDLIEVVIHPQSFVHGMLQMKDGTTHFHASPADMSYPIRYALGCDNTPHTESPIPLSTLELGALEFYPCPSERFGAITLAREALQEGFGYSMRLYVANEVAAQAFLSKRLPFSAIIPFLRFALEHSPLSSEVEYEELFSVLHQERRMTTEALEHYTSRNTG